MKSVFNEQHFLECNICGTRFEMDHLEPTCTHCGNGIVNCDFSFVVENDCGSAENALTKKRYGSWYCKDSKDHTCYYENDIHEDEGGDFVLLLNGEKEYLKDYNEEDHYWESCLFCGDSEERK